MRVLLAGLALALSSSAVRAQSRAAHGAVRDAVRGIPVANAVVLWLESDGSRAVRGAVTLTSSSGRFFIPRADRSDRLVVLAIGYRPDTVAMAGRDSADIRLTPAALNLEPLIAAAERARPEIGARILRDIDVALKPPQSSQELLRLAPGLVIAQHAGGGKAEQIFLRGFDADHGTDVAVSVDGVPVNLVSHAHGQGYADLHFVMPEIIEGLEVRKGGHDPRDGNLATAGAVAFLIRDRFDGPAAWARGGSFGTGVIGGVMPFGGAAGSSGGYVAAGATYADGPFERPQQHRRVNAFGRWSVPVGRRAELVLTGSGYDARWDASGQVPDRAIRAGTITRFGSIDPTEGGATSRFDTWALLRSRGSSPTDWQVRAFATRYRLDLFSNFTFFARDPVSGDGIEQRDARVLAGLAAEMARPNRLAGLSGRWSAGVGIRSDQADVALDRQYQRVRTEAVVSSRVSEQNGSGWVRQQLAVSDRFGLALGVRGDVFRFAVRDRGRGGPSGRETGGRISPKVSAHFELGRGVTASAGASAGFHSNDARDVVLASDTVPTLPRSVTVEFGLRRTFAAGTIGVAVWRTDLESELVFVGDEGTTEPSGRTRRVGVDLEGRGRLLPWLWADGDLNLVRGRLRDEPSGANLIALAPVRTGSAGLTVRSRGPLSGALRVRHIGSRAADERGEVTALGHTVTELGVSWRIRRAVVTLGLDNLFNVRWNEAQFATTSQLRGEAAPVTELHFTPGAPRRIEVGLRLGR